MKFACIILALLLVMTGFVFLSASNQPIDGKPAEISQVSYATMQEGDIYYMPQLRLYERFAGMENDAVIYMLAYFPDKEGDTVTATMVFSNQSPYWEEVNAYVADGGHEPGEFMTLDCYVSLARDTTPENAYYGEAYTQSYLQTYDALRLQEGFSVDIQRSVWQLNYICGADGDPYEGNRNTNTVTSLAGAACFVASTLVIYFGVIHKPRPKQAPGESRNG